MTLDEAWEHASVHAEESMWPDRDHAREIETGWYFPWRFDGSPPLGCNGLIVNKHTGKVTMLGSAYSLERDLRAYDAGYPLGMTDLIVTSVSNMDRAVQLLDEMGVSKVEPEEEGGVIWRIAKSLSRPEIRQRLMDLPAVFNSFQVYFHIEDLEGVKREGCFRFEFRD